MGSEEELILQPMAMESREDSSMNVLVVTILENGLNTIKRRVTVIKMGKALLKVQQKETTSKHSVNWALALCKTLLTLL